jgi:large subunit ribosomal protein L4
MNRKERRLAIRTAFQSRGEDLIVVEDFAENLSRPKTKELLGAFSRWGVEPNSKVLLILAEPAQNIYLSGRNVDRLKMIPATSLNVRDVLAADKIVTTAGAIAKIQEVYSD